MRHAWFALLLLASAAGAGEMDITWTAPTKNCDGTPLTNLSGYALQWGQSGAQLPAGALTYKVTGLTPGNWWASIAALSAAGERSEFVTVTKTVAQTEFSTVGGPAFTLVKKRDGFVLLPVGTVPAGVTCIAAQTVNGHYVVPRTAVAFSGSVQPDVVVAKCQ